MINLRKFITDPSKHPSLVVKMTFMKKYDILAIICQIQVFKCEKMKKNKTSILVFFRRLLKTPPHIPWTFIFNFLFIFRCFFSISGIFLKRFKMNKKRLNSGEKIVSTSFRVSKYTTPIYNLDVDINVRYDSFCQLPSQRILVHSYNKLIL